MNDQQTIHEQVLSIHRRTLRSGGDEMDVVTNWIHEILDPELGPNGFDPINFQRKCLELKKRHPGQANESQYLAAVAGIIDSTVRHGKQQGDLFGKEVA